MPLLGLEIPALPTDSSRVMTVVRTVRRSVSLVRSRRPVLLVLVYGVFLTLVGITASAQAFVVSEHLSATALNSVESNDAATIRTFVNGGSLRPSDFIPGGLDPDRAATIRNQLAGLVSRGEILRAQISTPGGTVIVADEPLPAGAHVQLDKSFIGAAAGAPQADLLQGGSSSGAAGPALTSTSLLREYLPLIANGRTLGVVGLWRDGTPILAQLDASRRDVVSITLIAALVLAVILFFTFRSAQRRLTRQTEELVEATRRDPQTGMLNHAALVERLGLDIEAARAAISPLSAVLVDIDNFRLLNDTHGHDTGEAALSEVADLLRVTMPVGSVVGRYGPDEFLVIAAGSEAGALLSAVESLRAGLAATTLSVASGDRLPITVSVGIGAYPGDADSVTDLLAVVATALGEAKASGGDRIRVAGQTSAAASNEGSFNILKGLVLAIDTKDHYTKQHSEDVARYALFLGRRIGLDETTLRALRVAGLLHDIGKIGIPDTLLRKPGRLTAEEYEVVQQHVALGDMIVRDLRDIDLVRAGIRHHHERWDGQGYLERLSGEDIPLLARILAVGDAFSAMTTTRPYRKALDVQEALRRLEDAAETQLDGRLVKAFVSGLETAPDAPLPGVASTARLWMPEPLMA